MQRLIKGRAKESRKRGARGVEGQIGLLCQESFEKRGPKGQSESTALNSGGKEKVQQSERNLSSDISKT